MAYLVTVGDGLAPRVVSVSVDVGPVHGCEPEPAPELSVDAGHHTAANVAVRPTVTVFWPVDEQDPKHALLVDGTATATQDGDRLVITPTSAILHRVRRGRGA